MKNGGAELLKGAVINLETLPKEIEDYLRNNFPKKRLQQFDTISIHFQCPVRIKTQKCPPKHG